MQTKNLEDRLSIRELAYTYARMVDDRNYPLADEIFTQDAELIGPGFHLRGRDEVRTSVPSIEHYRATLHNVYNQLFEIRGNEAEGETYCVANHLHEVDGKPYKLDWGIQVARIKADLEWSIHGTGAYVAPPAAPKRGSAKKRKKAAKKKTKE